jgi:hypothetical protein
MRHKATGFLCVISILAWVAQAQTVGIEPLRFGAGTVLNFHLQTRMHPGSDDVMALLPQGTVLRVKITSAIDSTVVHDGAEFRGVIASAVESGNEIVVHTDAEVRGVLALLRSKNHPDGFRYELLITNITDRGKSYFITASLNTSFFDGGSQAGASAKAATK